MSWEQHLVIHLATNKFLLFAFYICVVGRQYYKWSSKLKSI